MRHAVALFQRGDFAEAERICKAILGGQPEYFDALHLFGVVKAQQGHFDEADRLLRRALTVNPTSAEAHTSRGNVARARGHFEDALASYDRALAINPGLPGVLLNRGGALSALNRHEEALACYDRALTINPAFAEALNSRGAALSELKRHEEALASYDQALAIKPQLIEAMNNRSGALKDLERFDEALASYDRTLGLEPNLAVAHCNRGLVLSALERHVEALASYDRALALAPRFAEALNNRADALIALMRHEEALSSCERALAIKPAFAEALQNRGAARSYLGQHEAAIEDFQRALDLDDRLPFARGALLHSRMHCCDWRTYEADSKRVRADVRSGHRSAEPFVLLGISDSAQEQLRCAQTWVRTQCPRSAMTLWTGERYRHDRIRLAYVSANFRDHALGHLMVGLFEQHDRKRFETIAISLGRDDDSAMRSRLKGAFERFIDVGRRSDHEVAQRMREMEVDIAVDLTGFATDARPRIFALRPAPIQVGYLAYPGTMGADYIDYLLADEITIPPEHHDCYTEQVVYLPDSYLVNDSNRPIAERTPTRAEVGLPDHGFVFCSFNNNYKITPEIFHVWMRLLRETPGSVLWLLEGNTLAPHNLRQEAAARNIEPDRLVFGPRVKVEEHLARHRLADLFLDTLPCNAHTTASDALWAGVPVVTCLGTTFAGRVAASLLHAVGLPELITHSLHEYASLALRLATDQSQLREIRQKLASQRESWPLFDTDRSRQHIEAAYIDMWERYQRGEPRPSFAATPSAPSTSH
ncbi:MAG: tetratricopeptide repeat protein [Casimicrobiaceae bacterium]